MRHKAAAVVIAHNHPSGPPFATSGDRVTNGLIQSSLGAIGVSLLDDIVVKDGRCYGVMNLICKKFAESIKR